MTGKTAEERKREAADASEIAGVSPFPEPDYDRNAGGYEASAAPKRSKSLMKRIKSARQNPNVPPPADVDDVEMQGRQPSRRYGPQNTGGRGPLSSSNDSAASPSREWASSLTSPNLGVGARGDGGGSLGRSGTRRATQEEQRRYASHNTPTGRTAAGQTPTSSSGAEYFSEEHGSGPSDGGRGPLRSPGGASFSSPGGAGVGRSGSIFGRFGRSRKNGESAAVS